nr:MAG TPA: hypothetical protein [Caudoviricetes sp.]
MLVLAVCAPLVVMWHFGLFLELPKMLVDIVSHLVLQ